MAGLAVSAFVRGASRTSTPGPVIVDGATWEGCRVVWQGCDGSTWDLLADGAPVLLRALSGIGTPPVEAYRQASVGRAGSRRRGSRWLDREIVLTVEVATRDGSAAWVETDEAWWASIDPDRPGRLEITWGGRTRWVEATLADVAEVMDLDPTYTGRLVSSIQLTADPLWRGDDLVEVFPATGAIPFFSPSGSVLGISRPTMSTAQVLNPGDEPSWPVWEITGPASAVTVGVGGDLVECGAVPSGDTLVIDSRPGRQSVRLASTGEDRSSTVTSAVWAPIPGKVPVDLALVASGTSGATSTTVRLETLYRRPWGTR